MINNTLASLGGRGVDFNYIPLNHVDPGTGSFLCTPEFDCAATAFDSCLTDLVRDPYGTLAARSGAVNQLALSSFLACFEGPFANQEVQTNATRRRPCFDASFGTADANPWRAVTSCAADPSKVGPIMVALNRTRAPMYAKLQPKPGTFPHIFVDGVHQWNNSWTSLLRTI